MSVITQVSAVAFRASYRELVAAVKAAGIVESRRGTDRVFFDVTDDSVVVAAATPSRVLNVQLPAEAPAVGRLVLGHNAFSKALAAAGKGCRKADLDHLQVAISSDADAGTAQLAVDGYTIPLAVLSHDSFPDQIIPPASRVRVQRDAFAAMFGRVHAAASNDALVEVLTHVQATFDYERLELLATDRYRASHAFLPVAVPESFVGRQALLPAVAAKLLPFLDGEEIAIGLTDDAITIASGTVTMQMPTNHEDSYPKLGHLFPETDQVQATLDRAQFHRAAVRAAALTAAAGEKLSPVHLLIDTGSVTVVPTSFDGPGAGPALEADVTGATDPTDPCSIGLNRDYLVDAIAQFPQDDVTIHITAPNKPVMLTAKTGTFRHIIMPTRLLN